MKVQLNQVWLHVTINIMRRTIPGSGAMLTYFAHHFTQQIAKPHPCCPLPWGLVQFNIYIHPRLPRLLILQQLSRTLEARLRHRQYFCTLLHMDGIICPKQIQSRVGKGKVRVPVTLAARA